MNPVEPMTVADLIERLKSFPQDLLVGYKCCSEYVLMEADDLCVQSACEPRPDGWIQRKRPDMKEQRYLMFPGN